MIAFAASIVALSTAMQRAATAEATPAAELQSRMRAAIFGAASFRITEFLVRNDVDGAGAETIRVQATFVAPDRLRRLYDRGYGVRTVTIVGATQYLKNPKNGKWRSEPATESPLAVAAPMVVKDLVFTVLPDRRDGEKNVGAVDIRRVLKPEEPPAPSDGDRMTCTYDKSTFRPRTCEMILPTRGTATYTYGGWNDPANVIETPHADEAR
jgi:hypothetical protein